jgi:hypothetical protein
MVKEKRRKQGPGSSQLLVFATFIRLAGALVVMIILSGVGLVCFYSPYICYLEDKAEVGQ